MLQETTTTTMEVDAGEETPPEDAEFGDTDDEAEEAEAFMAHAAQNKLDALLRILGIDHVRDTIVGNAAIRGVSGGQRRRVTVGEMLMGKARVMCGDEISTGLDAQTTFEITRAFNWFTKYMDVTAILSLLQPPPESFELFDEVILLHDGTVAYHGPTPDILAHFKSIHLVPPPRKDVADFLVEITSSLELARGYCDLDRGEKEDAASSSPKKQQIPDYLEAGYYATAYRETSPHYARMLGELEHAFAGADASWTASFSQEFTKPLSYYWFACLRRKVVELKSNPGYVKSRFFQAFCMGLFTGTLFFQLNHGEFATKFGLLFSAAMYLALGGMSSIGKKVDDRTVFYKQRDQSFFPTISYALADIVVDSATVVCESALYVNLVFWAAGLSSESYGIFVAVLLVMSLAMNQWFATVASFAPDAAAGQPLAGMSVLLFVLFSGFIIQRENIPPGWRWLHWLSPIATSFRALAVSEFRSDRYDKCVYQANELGCGDDDPCCEENTDGIYFLKVYSVPTEPMWIWIALVQLTGYFFFFVWATTFCLTNIRHVTVAGGGSWVATQLGGGQRGGDDEDDPTTTVLGSDDDPHVAKDIRDKLRFRQESRVSQQRMEAAEAAAKEDDEGEGRLGGGFGAAARWCCRRRGRGREGALAQEGRGPDAAGHCVGAAEERSGARRGPDGLRQVLVGVRLDERDRDRRGGAGPGDSVRHDGGAGAAEGVVPARDVPAERGGVRGRRRLAEVPSRLAGVCAGAGSEAAGQGRPDQDRVPRD